MYHSMHNTILETKLLSTVFAGFSQVHSSDFRTTFCLHICLTFESNNNEGVLSSTAADFGCACNAKTSENEST